jgi:hypothetical protein
MLVLIVKLNAVGPMYENAGRLETVVNLPMLLAACKLYNLLHGEKPPQTTQRNPAKSIGP